MKNWQVIVLSCALAGLVLLGGHGPKHAQAAGASYYVDSVSGSDNNLGTSTGSPWRSLANVHARNFLPGDTVNFKRGSSWTGELLIDNSGAQGNPITFRAYGSGAAPIISNPGTSTNAVRITASWVVVQDFLVRDAGRAGVRLDSTASHNIVRNVEATNVGLGVLLYGQYNLVTSNLAHHLRMITNTPGGDDDWGAVGYWIEAPNNELSYNRCLACRASSYDYGSDGGVIEIYRNGDNSYIHHNYGAASDGFVEIGGGSARNVRVAYNVSDNNYNGFGCLHLGGNFASIVENFRIEHNTIVKTMSQGWRVLDCLSSGVTASQLLFRNNIVYSSIPVSQVGTFTHRNNLYHMLNGASIGYSLGTGEKTGSPQFVNASGGDYHLQSNSPAINAGLSLGYPLDYDGRLVPQGSAPDMGAYEFLLNLPTYSNKVFIPFLKR